MNKIPKEFLDDMKFLLGKDFDAFADAMCNGEPKKGLRINTLKVSCDAFESISPFSLQKSPLCTEGYIVSSEERAGSHAYHHAGLYYMQEPSAGCVVEALNPKENMRVLDLCAAPGGKSGHIAARLAGTGLLVANECVSARAKILRSNMERLGVKNACITSAMPDRIAQTFPSYFDAVVVDAPCSGEGMFRKEESACTDWSREHVKSCAVRQRSILDSAAETLCENGTLLYSTCTLNPTEDEWVIDDFLKSHPEFTMEKIDAVTLPSAHPEWCNANESIRLAAKLMPHEIDGEGHFVARLRKTDGTRCDSFTMPKKSSTRQLSKSEFSIVKDFWNEHFSCQLWGEPILCGDVVYLPSIQPSLPIICSGVPIGSIKGSRFEPEHGLYLALSAEDSYNKVCLDPSNPLVHRYLAGEEIPYTGEKGYCMVCVGTDGYAFPIGFGKASGGVLKNKYPKGLRR